MNDDPLALSPAPPAGCSPCRVALRIIRAGLIFLVVAWHLVFFAVRNPLDLWKKGIREYLATKQGWEEGGERAFDLVDLTTNHFANLSGCEQRWVMFSPPMARGAGFLATRFEFSDGSTFLVPSDNEPTPDKYFRVGGWQARKLEDSLFEVPPATDKEMPMWSAFIRLKVREWDAGHPDDPREMVRVLLVKRRISFPRWDEPVGVYRAPEETTLGTFDPTGRLLP